jgi:hypothetical protein
MKSEIWIRVSSWERYNYLVPSSDKFAVGLYQQFGDKALLARHLPMMKDWVGYIKKIEKDDKTGGKLHSHVYVLNHALLLAECLIWLESFKSLFATY